MDATSFAASFKSRVTDVITPAMIEEAKSETERLGLGNVELLVMDAEDDHLFAPGSFDYVIGSYSIIFLPDSFAALTRFRKLLAPDGKLAFTSPVFERCHSWLVDRERLAATLGAAGFDNVVILDEPVQMVSGSGHDWVAWSTPVRYVRADVAPHRHTSAGQAR